MHQLGHTRSANRRDHLLHTPDAFVRTPLPGLSNGAAIVHVAPQIGAAFAMMTVEFELDGKLNAGPDQRFAFVIEGQIAFQEVDSPQIHALRSGSFVYIPPGHPHAFVALGKARLLVIEKPYIPLDPANAEALDDPSPELLIGHEEDVDPVPLNGDEGLQVRALLPASSAFDFAVNTMTYAPGASLSQVEIHYMEHGLLMLEGGGIYRLGDAWYPVQTGDAIWMAPFCPQWFGAIGKAPAKYIIYKDFNRHVLE